jgi:3-hydroxybutyrate dehydrogenase
MLSYNAPGIICCISSVAAQIPSVITPLYGVAKAGVNHFVRCMAKLHEMAGIRVVGVAPGLIDTPLFSDHPEANRFVDRGKDIMIKPEVIADGMVRVSLDSKYPSGTILEVTGEEHQREVMLLKDPGPQGFAILASKKDIALEDITAIIEQDKKSSK